MQPGIRGAEGGVGGELHPPPTCTAPLFSRCCCWGQRKGKVREAPAHGFTPLCFYLPAGCGAQRALQQGFEAIGEKLCASGVRAGALNDALPLCI